MNEPTIEKLYAMRMAAMAIDQRRLLLPVSDN